MKKQCNTKCNTSDFSNVIHFEIDCKCNMKNVYDFKM